MRRNQAEVGEESHQLRASVKDAKRGFTDDTGWRINGESASMMGSDTDEATVYKSVLRQGQIVLMPTSNSIYGTGDENNYCNEEFPLHPISQLPSRRWRLRNN